MKELKFRVWEEREKAYNTWSYILDTIGNLFRNVYGALIGCDKKDYIVEQYTGLKDKNGKEICEGDIIKVDNDKLMIPHEHKTEASEVFYSNCETAFVYRTWYGEIPVSRHDTSVEVIGNIHENNELLGGKK